MWWSCDHHYTLPKHFLFHSSVVVSLSCSLHSQFLGSKHCTMGRSRPGQKLDKSLWKILVIEYITPSFSFYRTSLDGWGNMHEKSGATEDLHTEIFKCTSLPWRWSLATLMIIRHSTSNAGMMQFSCLPLFAARLIDVASNIGYIAKSVVQSCGCRWLLVANVGSKPAKRREDHNSMPVCVPMEPLLFMARKCKRWQSHAPQTAIWIYE